MLVGLIRLMNQDEITGPVNIGNPREMTIRELAEMVLAKIGGKSQLIKKPLPEDDPLQRKPNITLAQSKLGWEPKVKLEDGLDKTIAYFAAQQKAGLL